ncbi:MAG: hypothetical protein WC705_00070 [Candidatus Paceibacterota bacterium]|jgi:hypothetical protein
MDFEEKKYTREEWEEIREKERNELIKEIAEVTVSGVVILIIFLSLFWIEGRILNWINIDLYDWGKFYLSTSDDPMNSFSVSWGVIFIIILNIYITKKISNKIFKNEDNNTS